MERWRQAAEPSGRGCLGVELDVDDAEAVGLPPMPPEVAAKGADEVAERVGTVDHASWRALG